MKTTKKRTLYKKLLTYFFLCIVVVELTLGASFMYISGNIMKEQVNKSNSEYLRQILFQMEEMIGTIDNAIVNFGAQGIVSATLKNTASPVDKFAEYMELMSMLYVLKQTNPYVDSVYLHIRQDGKILTGDNAIYAAEDYPELAGQSLGRDNNLILRAPTGFRMFADEQSRMLTMVRELPLVPGKQELGALIVRISEEKLNASINADRVRETEEIMVIDSRGAVISGRSKKRLYAEYDWSVKIADTAVTGGYNGAMVEQVDGVKSMLTYYRSARYDWSVVSSLPYGELFREFNRLRTLMLIIAMAGLLVFLPIAGYLSRRLYYPISRLNELLMQHRSPRAEQSRDELQSINESVASLLTDNASAYELLAQIKPAARDKFVKDLLLGRQHDPDVVQERLEMVGLRMNEDRFLVFVLETDKPRREDRVPDSRNPELKSRLESYLHEQGYTCAIVEMEADRLACLLNFPDGSHLDEDNVYFVLLDFKDRISRELSFTLTIGVGRARDELTTVSASSDEAIRSLQQKLAFGRDQVIRFHDIDTASVGPDYLDKDYIEYVLKHLKAGRLDLCADKTNEVIDRMIAEKLDSAVMLRFFHRLLNLVTYTLSEMGVGAEAALGPGRNLEEELGTHEDIGDMKLWFRTLFERIGEAMQQKDDKSPNELIRKVKEYASSNYSGNISIGEMAERVFLHPHYLGKMFKKVEGIAWNEYVMQVRMEKARELLLGTSMKLSDISEAVGIGSAQYLIYCFKNKYGVTPKKLRELHPLEPDATVREEEAE